MLGIWAICRMYTPYLSLFGRLVSGYYMAIKSSKGGSCEGSGGLATQALISHFAAEALRESIIFPVMTVILSTSTTSHNRKYTVCCCRIWPLACLHCWLQYCLTSLLYDLSPLLTKLLKIINFFAGTFALIFCWTNVPSYRLLTRWASRGRMESLLESNCSHRRWQ